MTTPYSYWDHWCIFIRREEEKCEKGFLCFVLRWDKNDICTISEMWFWFGMRLVYGCCSVSQIVLIIMNFNDVLKRWQLFEAIMTPYSNLWNLSKNHPSRRNWTIMSVVVLLPVDTTIRKKILFLWTRLFGVYWYFKILYYQNNINMKLYTYLFYYFLK